MIANYYGYGRGAGRKSFPDELNATLEIDDEYKTAVWTIGNTLEGMIIHHLINRDGEWWLHRSGGLPAMYDKDQKWVSFFEYGVSKRIEDLEHDMDKVVATLSHSHREFHLTWYAYYR